MKAIKRTVFATVALISTLTLGACSNNNQSINLELDNGEDYFITTDLKNINNQEAFEAMVSSVDSSSGFNNGVLALLDLVDKELLIGNFEIDHEEIENRIDAFRVGWEDFDNFLISNGFESEEDLALYLELLSTRTAAARAAVVVTDEDIEEAYNLIYGLNDEEEEADETDEDETEATEDETDVDVDAEDEEEEAIEEIPTLEEVRDELKEDLIQNQLTPSFIQTELARLRYEAGFEILDSYLQDQYVLFLEGNGVNVTDVFETTTNNDKAIVATLGDIEFTTEQLFDMLLPTVGLSAGISLIDPVILMEEFEVTDEVVSDMMNELKITLADQFYPTMAQQLGLHSDEEIFNHLRNSQLQNEAFLAVFTPTEERINELYETYGEDEISVRHILVEDEELAKELIEQLNDADDVEALFIELAMEHSTCPSGAQGGDLGMFGPENNFVEEFSDASFELELNEFSTEPVESSFGYHIIFRYENVRPSLEELEAQELNRLFTQERLEYVLIGHRQAVNLAFTNDYLQTRYDVISENIFALLEETE